MHSRFCIITEYVILFYFIKTLQLLTVEILQKSYFKVKHDSKVLRHFSNLLRKIEKTHSYKCICITLDITNLTTKTRLRQSITILQNKYDEIKQFE